MSERFRNVLTITAIAVIAIVVVTLVATNPTQADRVESIGGQIKCPVCQGESIGDSPADMARDMMNLVEDRVAAGFSDDEIIDELLASYSGAVLLDPPASGNTLALWLAPALVLIVGTGVIVWWRRHPGSTEETATVQEKPTSSRRLVGGLVLLVSIAGAVVVAGFSLQDRNDTTTGVADQQIENLDDVSNETMEAVVAANLDNPQINGMRLALAERYYTINDYRSAFPHYLAVAESEAATPDEALTALIRLGLMAWEGNQEAEAAIALFDEALEISPRSSTAAYLKAQVLWCGLSDPQGASDLLEMVLANDELPADSRELVEGDLSAISAGEGCE